MEDLTGKRFGRLVVAGLCGHNKYGQAIWACKCDCGNISKVRGSDLRTGRTLSCGCLWKERIVEAKTTHGMSRSEIYATYKDMKSRCYNEKAHNYEYYGGRGIQMCDKWRDDIREFYNDVSKLPNFGEKGYTLDRIDNDGDYEPENVRWASCKEQCGNKRPRTDRRKYDYNGEMHTLKEISAITGISHSTLSNRLRKGWDPDRAFNTPLQEKFRHKTNRGVV